MILSVSRRTDIPNYYGDWFLNRIREGFLYVRNPVNPHQISRIDLSPDVVDCIVFWTKNPADMMEKLDGLQDYMYYFQFTLTGYGKDMEPGLPDKKDLIDTFQRLSKRLGKERVIWRYDPIWLSGRYTEDYHISAFEQIAERLTGYTEKVVISFVDWYAKTQRNMTGLKEKEQTEEEQINLAGKLALLAPRYQLSIESCAEKLDLEKAGVRHGACIDKGLIERLAGCRLTGGKDRNQREACGCMESIEVGAYDTCPNGCRYCYANENVQRVREKRKLYQADAPLLCGKIGPGDRITERKMKSLKDGQICLEL
jgi:hypothetical protein